MSCDVTNVAGTYVRATAHGGHVTFAPGGSARLGGSYAVDVRVAANGGIYAVAAVVDTKPSDPVDRLVVATNQGVTRPFDDLIPSGEHAVAIKPSENGFAVACVNVRGRRLTALVLNPDLSLRSASHSDVSTSQGILDWPPSGVALVDDNFIVELGGVKFVKPMHRGAWTVGLHPDNRIILFDHANARVLASTLSSQKLARLAINADGFPLVAATGENTFLDLGDFAPLEDPMPSSLLPLLQQERAKYPGRINNDQCVALLNAVAWRAHHEGHGEGWGLLRKDAGNHGVRRDGTRCSVDWLVHLPSGTGGDVLIGAGDGDSVPTWPNPLEPFDTARFVPPIHPDSTPVPDPPTPVPQPPSDDLAQRVAALEARVAALETRQYVVQLPVLPVKR